MDLSNGEIHYVYGDGDQEYVLGNESDNPELGEIICSDGSRAVLINGQYYLTDNSQTILFQGSDADLTPYYTNDSPETFVVGGEDVSVNNLFDGTEIVQFVEDDAGNSQQVIYYTNEDTSQTQFDLDQVIGDGNAVESIQDEDGNIYPLKRIKLETQMMDFEGFVQEQANESNFINQLCADNPDVQFTVLEEETGEVAASAPPDSAVAEPRMFDLSKITGRNLITGQTVTLHSYMEKLKKKFNTDDISRFCQQNKNVPVKQDAVNKNSTPPLVSLLDKKIPLGKTKSGKNIVAKIIQVGRKEDQVEPEVAVEEMVVTPTIEEDEDTLVINDVVTDNNGREAAILEPPLSAPEPPLVVPKPPTRTVVKRCRPSPECLEEICKTLGGVMEMEAARKKMQNKNIIVKFVEKKHIGEAAGIVKTTSYVHGYMEKITEENLEGVTMERWRFVPDQGAQDASINEHENGDENDDDQPKLLQPKQAKFPSTTSLTMSVSYNNAANKESKSIRVNLSSLRGNLCTICGKYFKTGVQLRTHMNTVHSALNTSCEVCSEIFDDPQQLAAHRTVHVEEGKLFICSVCNKCFTSQTRLQKHLPVHDLYLRPLECSVCELRCSSEWALKKHLLTHTGIKPYSCDICQKQFLSQYDVNFHKKIHFPEKHYACNICLRTFSRHSNLLRHAEIHKSSGASYKCDICYCSYNFISSLTRHMVQNHIEARDFTNTIEAAE